MILGPRGSRAIRERRGAWQGKRRCGMHATNMERCGNDFHFAHLRVCRCECVFIDVGLNYGKTLLSWPHAALRAMRQQNSTLWSAVDRCICEDQVRWHSLARADALSDGVFPQTPANPLTARRMAAVLGLDSSHSWCTHTIQYQIHTTLTYGCM